MKIFDEKTFKGWYRKGWALGFVVGFLLTEAIKSIIRLL